MEGMLQSAKKRVRISFMQSKKRNELKLPALNFKFVLPDLLCQGRFATVLMEMRKQTDFVTIIQAERDLKSSR